MKRNTALFGASVAAGLAAATGLVVTSSASSAASSTYYGVSFYSASSNSGSGWKTGAYADTLFAFSGTAAVTPSGATGTFHGSSGAVVSVSSTCSGANLVTTVSGGGAAGTYQPGASVSLADFIGVKGEIGTVTFGSVKVNGHTAGAYINMSQTNNRQWVALTGADCAGATTPPPTTSTTTSTTSPTTTPTTKPTSSTSTGTGTGTPTGTPTTTPPPTTEPPTPTPTTTTLPVTG